MLLHWKRLRLLCSAHVRSLYLHSISSCIWLQQLCCVTFVQQHQLRWQLQLYPGLPACLGSCLCLSV